jgi:hypothetical protein
MDTEDDGSNDDPTVDELGYTTDPTDSKPRGPIKYSKGGSVHGRIPKNECGHKFSGLY